jgi:hypothetical protein
MRVSSLRWITKSFAWNTASSEFILCQLLAKAAIAAEQRDELATFHCPMPPVLLTERIAHISRETAALQDFDAAYARFGSFASY